MKEKMGEHAQPKKLAGGDQAVQVPGFAEMKPEEQIQVLRRELVMLRELVNSQQALIERLMVHQHDTRGEMVVPMRSSGGMNSGLLSGAMSRRDPLR